MVYLSSKILESFLGNNIGPLGEPCASYFS
jgi:hypothetical protein